MDFIEDLHVRSKLLPIDKRHNLPLLKYQHKFRDDPTKVAIPNKNTRNIIGTTFTIERHHTKIAYKSPFLKVLDSGTT